MNKIIIINSTGQLGNKLWLNSSVYAYCLEKNYICENYDFNRPNHEYSKYFNFAAPKLNLNILLFQKYLKLQTKYPALKILKKALAFLFLGGVELVEAEQPDRIFYLPPDDNKDAEQLSTLEKIENSSDKTFYFSGFFFSNSVGIKKYREEIADLFKPKKQYLEEVNDFLKPLRDKYKLLVGVHMRLEENQKIFESGHVYTFEEFRRVLEDFLNSLKQFAKEDVVFILCSDLKFDPKEFKDFNTVPGPGGIITDLYSLAGCDLIIGSNSTYGAWASFYGGIPHIRFSTEKINWSDKLADLKK